MPHCGQLKVILRQGIATKGPFGPSTILTSRITKLLSKAIEQKACSRSSPVLLSRMRTSVISTAISSLSLGIPEAGRDFPWCGNNQSTPPTHHSGTEGRPKLALVPVAGLFTLEFRTRRLDPFNSHKRGGVPVAANFFGQCGRLFFFRKDCEPANQLPISSISMEPRTCGG